MLKSQVRPGAANDGWGREGFIAEKTQVGDAMERYAAKNGEVGEMQIGLAWAKMAKKEGHKRKLPPSPAPKDQSAEGGRMSRRYPGVKGRVYEAVKELAEPSTVNEVVAYTGENKSTVREWFRFFRTSGVLVQQQKKGNEYGYIVNKSLNNKEECVK